MNKIKKQNITVLSQNSMVKLKGGKVLSAGNNLMEAVIKPK